MIGNVALDTLVGAVPILGDLFDVAYKSNVRNVALLERFATEPAVVTARSRRLGVMVVIVFAVLLIAIGYAAFAALRFVWQLLAN